MASFEIRWNYGPVFLLPSRIPNVQFGRLSLQRDIFHFEINCSHKGAFFWMEFSLHESPKKRSFPDITIAHQNELILLLFPER